MLILLLGLTGLVFWLGSPPFLVLCTGLLVSVDLGSFWDFMFGTSDSFLSNGLVTVCLVKRLLDLMLGLKVRSFFLPSVPVSEGIEIRHGCQFLSSLVRALAKLPGGLGRFVPCHLGSHML